MKLPPKIEALIAAATDARRHAYCPLTKYAVGASVLGGSGRIYRGCNIESPTGIIHVCADRAAIFAALSYGEKEITAVCTMSRGSVPCGTCRQAILEFAGKHVPIYSVTQGSPFSRRKIIKTTIAGLLPMAHTPATVGYRGKK